MRTRTLRIFWDKKIATLGGRGVGGPYIVLFTYATLGGRGVGGPYIVLFIYNLFQQNKSRNAF